MVKCFRIGVFLLFAAGAVCAQVLDRASFKLEGVPSSIKAGASFKPRITAIIEPGWHIYSLTRIPNGPIPTQITVPKTSLFRLGEIDTPVPVVDHDPGFGVDVEYYEGEAEFKVPLTSKAKMPLGKHKLTINVRYQACDKQMCLPPRSVELTTEITVTKSR